MMQPEKQEVERKPLSKLAAIAMRELNKNTAASMQEILSAASEEQGISAEDGWGFDPQSMSWARHKPQE